MSTPINDSKTLTADGGGDDTYSATAELNTGSAKAQVDVGGATTGADVFVEGRLTASLQWVQLHSATGVANGTSNLWTVDTDDLLEVRVRVVNTDGTNGAEVDAVVRTT